MKLYLCSLKSRSGKHFKAATESDKWRRAFEVELSIVNTYARYTDKHREFLLILFTIIILIINNYAQFLTSFVTFNHHQKALWLYNYKWQGGDLNWNVIPEPMVQHPRRLYSPEKERETKTKYFQYTV